MFPVTKRDLFFCTETHEILLESFLNHAGINELLPVINKTKKGFFFIYSDCFICR